MTLSFLLPKIMEKFERDHPLRERQMQVGWVKIGDFRRKTRYKLPFNLNSNYLIPFRVIANHLSKVSACGAPFLRDDHVRMSPRSLALEN